MYDTQVTGQIERNNLKDIIDFLYERFKDYNVGNLAPTESTLYQECYIALLTSPPTNECFVT